MITYLSSTTNIVKFDFNAIKKGNLLAALPIIYSLWNYSSLRLIGADILLNSSIDATITLSKSL